MNEKDGVGLLKIDFEIHTGLFFDRSYDNSVYEGTTCFYFAYDRSSHMVNVGITRLRDNIDQDEAYRIARGALENALLPKYFEGYESSRFSINDIGSCKWGEIEVI